MIGSRNQSENPFDEYLRLLPQFVALYGEKKGWSPLLINKAYLLLTNMMGILVPFSVGKKPIVSRTQEVLHIHHSRGMIRSPTLIDKPVSIESNGLAKVESEYSAIKSEIDEIASLAESSGHIWGSREIERRLLGIGSGSQRHIEKSADQVATDLVKNCGDDLDYLNPRLRGKAVYVNDSPRTRSRRDYWRRLDMFIERLESAAGESVPLSRTDMEPSYYASKMRELVMSSGRLSSVKMTDPTDSLLKSGKSRFVMNFRYLEFLRCSERERGWRPIVFHDKNEKHFLLAVAENTRAESIPSSWTELCVFDVTGMSESEICSLANRLERYLVLLLAKRFEIPIEWMKRMDEAFRNLKREVVRVGAAGNQDLGKYGGEVYCLVSSISDKTVNFPVPEQDFKSYIKKVIAQTYRAAADHEISELIERHASLQDLRDCIKGIAEDSATGKATTTKKQAECFEDRLRCVCATRKSELNHVLTPLYLKEILTDGKFNCEGIIQFALYLIICRKVILHHPISVKVCCLPPEILHKYSIRVRDPHMFLVFEDNGYQILFDPMGILKEQKLGLGEKETLYAEISQGYCVDTRIPVLTSSEDVFSRITEKDGLFIVETNLSSPCCVITSLKNKSLIKSIKDYAGFIVYIPSKHIEAGMPNISVIGSTIRRLLIGLSRNQNVKKIVLVETEADSKETKQYVSFLKQTIQDIKDQDKRVLGQVHLRGRMSRYGIEIGDIARMIGRVDAISCSDVTSDVELMRIESEIVEEASSVKEIFLPNATTSMDVYPAVEYKEKRLGTSEGPFTSVRELYDNAEVVLADNGKVEFDTAGMKRVFVMGPFLASLSKYDDLYEFLKQNGIVDYEKMYSECLGEGGVFSGRLKDRYERFRTDLTDAVNSGKVVTNGLFLVTDSEARFGETQIGWVGVFPYIEYDDDSVTISFLHELRSVDLHDGLPINIFFCIRLSQEIMRRLREDKRSEKDVKLGIIHFNIYYLHAYPDNLGVKKTSD